MQLVGLVGKSGVGKSTIANQLASNNDFRIVPFAKPLKRALQVLTGLPYNNFTDPILKEKKIGGLNDSPRTLMQKFGTDFVRHQVSTDFWIWRMKRYIADTHDLFMVIDDIRFRNEADMVKEFGGCVIHLKRDFEPLTKCTSHSSEKGVKIFIDEYTVNGNYDELSTYQIVLGFIKQHYGE